MTEEQPTIVDWIHPPAGVEEESLWVALHDSELTVFDLDAPNNFAHLEFDIAYLWEFHSLPETTRLHVDFSGLQALRAERSRSWIGDFPEIEQESRDERDKRVKEYWAKWITTSLNFIDFLAELEVAFQADSSFLVLQPKLLRGDGAVSLQIFGYEEDNYTEWMIRARELSIQLSTGTRMTVEELVEFGGKYWEAFGKRNEKQSSDAG